MGEDAGSRTSEAVQLAVDDLLAPDWPECSEPDCRSEWSEIVETVVGDNSYYIPYCDEHARRRSNLDRSKIIEADILDRQKNEVRTDGGRPDARSDQSSRGYETPLSEGVELHPAVDELGIELPETAVTTSRFGYYYRAIDSDTDSCGFALLVCPFCLEDLSGKANTANHFKDHPGEIGNPAPAVSPASGGDLRAD